MDTATRSTPGLSDKKQRAKVNALTVYGFPKDSCRKALESFSWDF